MPTDDERGDLVVDLERRLEARLLSKASAGLTLRPDGLAAALEEEGCGVKDLDFAEEEVRMIERSGSVVVLLRGPGNRGEEQRTQ